jgi:hypothetical protein
MQICMILCECMAVMAKNVRYLTTDFPDCTICFHCFLVLPMLLITCCASVGIYVGLYRLAPRCLCRALHLFHLSFPPCHVPLFPALAIDRPSVLSALACLLAPVPPSFTCPFCSVATSQQLPENDHKTTHTVP